MSEERENKELWAEVNRSSAIVSGVQERIRGIEDMQTDCKRHMANALDKLAMNSENVFKDLRSHTDDQMRQTLLHHEVHAKLDLTHTELRNAVNVLSSTVQEFVISKNTWNGRIWKIIIGIFIAISVYIVNQFLEDYKYSQKAIMINQTIEALEAKLTKHNMIDQNAATGNSEKGLHQ